MTAPIKWAQRSDSLFLTIAIADCKDETVNLTDDKLVFTGKSGGKEYAVDISFFKKCNGEKSTYKVNPRSIQMLVIKDEEEEDFWPRLLKDKVKEKNQVTIDWDKYVDQDEEDEAEKFDDSGMGGMGQGGPPGLEYIILYPLALAVWLLPQCSMAIVNGHVQWSRSMVTFNGHVQWSRSMVTFTVVLVVTDMLKERDNVQPHASTN